MQGNADERAIDRQLGQPKTQHGRAIPHHRPARVRQDKIFERFGDYLVHAEEKGGAAQVVHRHSRPGGGEADGEGRLVERVAHGNDCGENPQGDPQPHDEEEEARQRITQARAAGHDHGPLPCAVGDHREDAEGTHAEGRDGQRARLDGAEEAANHLVYEGLH